ncbi:MAG: conjugal transfer protein TrbD [Allorhizobium sp.]
MSEREHLLDLHPIHRALSRPNLMFGADRELVLVTGLISAILIFVVITVYALTLGCLAWFITLALLRRMAKSDPLMRRVYLRHIRYRPLYRPTATPFNRG